MANYKKRKDGRYAVNVDVGYFPDGRRKRKTIYARTINELNIKLAELRLQIDSGHIINDNNMTLGQWALTWLPTYKTNISDRTYKDYEGCIKNHIVNASIGSMRIQKIKPVHIQQWINEMADTPRIAKIAYMLLKRIMKQAVFNDFISKNPAENVNVPLAKTPKKWALNEQQIRWIENTDLGFQERVFMFLGLFCGLRKGEILALSIQDFDLENAQITITKTLTFYGNKSQIKNSPKTQAGFRTVPIPEPLYSCLKEYISKLNTTFLFTTMNGDLSTTSSYKRMWEKIISKLYLDKTNNPLLPYPQITAHILRHTYATNLFYAGVDIKTAQYLLGHSSVDVLLDIYTHFRPNNDDVLNKLYAYRER